ncbi:MAG: YraN family protein [Cyanobacteria bacterium J06597_1]
MSIRIGNLGEQLVCDRLQTLGWTIAARQWKCRWGELDIVAVRDSDLKFVEVKTRSHRNWDASGALAITPRKQRRLIRTAQVFLQQHPDYFSCNCIFDAALVSIGDRQHLELHEYIESAFEL